MRKPSRTAIYSLIAIFTIGAIGSGMAVGADKERFKTKVSIGFQGSDYGDRFFGKVKPRKATGKTKRKCRRGRKVTVFRKTSSGRQRIGTDRTNRRGRYDVSVGGIANPGSYFARAKTKKFTKRDGTKVVCKRGKSKRIAVS